MTAPTPAPLHLTLSVTPSEPQPKAAVLHFTATVTSTGPLPPVMSFAWNYFHHGAPGITDEVTTGGSSATVLQQFNTAGDQTVVVTVTTADGRSATASVTLTVQ